MIRLVVLDIDGCLTAGEAQPFDLAVFEYIAGLNRRSRSDAHTAAVTLCTGRQGPYVEALMQAIDGHQPAIYENGAGLYFPSTFRFLENPSLTAERRAARDVVRQVLRDEIVGRGLGVLQPGKEINLTLYPARPGVSLQELGEAARSALGKRLDGFSLFVSVTSVEILPQGIDKGGGVDWLARETGIACESMAGIGDAPADLTYLTKLGYSAAPANAAAAVRSAVSYVSPEPYGRGVVDILGRWLGSPADVGARQIAS